MDIDRGRMWNLEMCAEREGRETGKKMEIVDESAEKIKKNENGSKQIEAS